MPLRFAPILPVLLGVASAQLGLGLLSPLITLLLLGTGTSVLAIGVVASAYFVGFLAGALTAPRLVLRVGHIRAFAAFAAVAAIMAQSMVFAHEAWQLACARVVMGYASSGMFLVAESWLNDRAEAATRGRIFGAYQVVNWSASAAGPLALNLLPPSPALFAACGVAFTASLLPMALTRQSNPEIDARVTLKLRRLYAASPVGVTCCIAGGLLNSSFYALVPVYLGERGLDAGRIAGFLSLALIAAFLVQYPLGLLADRFGRRRLTLVVVLAGLCAAIVLAALRQPPAIAIQALGCLLAASTAPLYGLGAGQVNDRLERGEYVAAAGGLLFLWSVGAAVGPGIAGALMRPLGSVGLFVHLGAVLALVAAFTLFRMRRRSDLPLDLQSPFVPGGATPPRLPQLASPAEAEVG